MTTKPGGKVKPFSDPAFGVVVHQWQAWLNGISPTRKPKGYSGQNPDLLAAFAALDRARSRADAYWNNPKNR